MNFLFLKEFFLRKYLFKRKFTDSYFMGLAYQISKNSTCNRGQIGCLIVFRNKIISYGWPHTPRPLKNCEEIGHLLWEFVYEDGNKTSHCVRTIHAEEAAICHAASKGVSIKNSTVYITHAPCRKCALLLISAKVSKVVVDHKFHENQISENLFKEANIKFISLHDEVIHN